MKQSWKRILFISFIVLGALALSAFIVACGGGHSSQSAPPNPAPSIQSISPTFVTAGSSSQTIEISGSGFLSSSAVTFNGASHSANFVNSGQLNVTLSASDLATAGNFPMAVTNPPPGGGTSASTRFSIWNKETESTTGLQFATPPFGGSGQLSVDTSTPGQVFVDFQLENGTSTPVSEFALTIYSNSQGLSLTQWFEQNVDVNGILQANNTFQQQTLANGAAALVLVGSVPQSYFDAGGGPPIESAYTELQSGQVASIRQAPANDLASYGYSTSQSLLQLKLQMLGTVHF